jgi:hypothetical protein
MKKLINSVFLMCLIITASFVAKGQEAKNKKTFEQASSNKAKIELIVNKNMADIIIKNHETYYKDFLTVSKESIAQGEIQLTISANTPEYERIVKRILIASEIKEIVFSDKKASLEEFFGF